MLFQPKSSQLGHYETSGPPTGHYETFLHGLFGTISDITRLFYRRWKIFSRARCARFLSPSELNWELLFFLKNFLTVASRRVVPSCPSPHVHTRPFGTLEDLSQDVRISSLWTLRGPFGTLPRLFFWDIIGHFSVVLRTPHCPRSNFTVQDTGHTNFILSVMPCYSSFWVSTWYEALEGFVIACPQPDTLCR